ncbi:MAG: hypothetical protein V1776_05275 [Candidatus Diapherotrites archaeon]
MDPTLNGLSENEPTSRAAAHTPRALAIAGIIIVLLFIVGFLIFSRLTTPTPEEPIVLPVKVKLLADTSCTLCPQTNTLLAKLDEGNVQYELETVDIYSEEGKELATEFEISYAPALLVSVAGLDQNTMIQSALLGKYIKEPLKTKKGWIVVPEKFLDKEPKLLTFINQPTTCEVPEGKILLTAFMDYGDCKPCIDAYKKLTAVTEKYTNVVVDYTPIMYQRTTITAINKAFTSNKGAVCAEKLGFLDDYTGCNYFNSQFYGNLDINFMKSCIAEAGGKSKEKQTEFVECVNDANSTTDAQLIQNSQTNEKWNPIEYTPSFVLDCTYSFVGQNSIEPYLCYFHPELEGCISILDEEGILNTPIQNTPIQQTETEDMNDE